MASLSRAPKSADCTGRLRRRRPAAQPSCPAVPAAPAAPEGRRGAALRGRVRVRPQGAAHAAAGHVGCADGGLDHGRPLGAASAGRSARVGPRLPGEGGRPVRCSLPLAKAGAPSSGCTLPWHRPPARQPLVRRCGRWLGHRLVRGGLSARRQSLWGTAPWTPCWGRDGSARAAGAACCIALSCLRAWPSWRSLPYKHASPAPLRPGKPPALACDPAHHGARAACAAPAAAAGAGPAGRPLGLLLVAGPGAQQCGAAAAIGGGGGVHGACAGWRGLC